MLRSLMGLFVLTVFGATTASASDPVFSSQAAAQPPQQNSDSVPDPVLAAVLRWNHIAIDASGLDHTPLQPGETRKYAEQLGPGRSARAIAIVHIAIFEALNAIGGTYSSYVGLPQFGTWPSREAAIAQAAHGTLIAMFPSQRTAFNQALREDLKRIPNIYSRSSGAIIGALAAARILIMRHNDGAQHAEPSMDSEFVPSQEPGKWRQDPISLVPIAMGAYWSHVKPFALQSADQFRVPPPPAMESEEYAAAFEEVKRLGGDGITMPTERSADQTTAGIYWAYDGTPSLCAPPRLYNQIATTIAKQKGSDALSTARLLALVNVALADAGIAIWESKYYYQFWRPITAIREADENMGPTGAGDGNPYTVADPQFVPLGAPASNLLGPNFTPPFPSYPSGHAGFGGALFQVLRRFYGTDEIAFTFVSDEFNGTTADNTGAIRPLVPRTFPNLSAAEEENALSRVYLGIHWRFDASEGITQGQQVADRVVDKLFRPK